MKTKNKIKVVAASITGPQHRHKKLPCQDFYKFHTQGKNFVAVVSDGAGSAKYGKTGARIICETMVDLLKNSPVDLIPQRIAKAVETARRKLTLHRLNPGKKIATLNNFAATLVGVVYHQGKGLFFHIGDGAGLAFEGSKPDHFVASPPENGNFSCETFFYTQDNWQENLRLTKFEGLNTIMLMTDGLTNFAFANDFQNIERGFVLPIHDFLSRQQTVSRAQTALSNTLDNAQARKFNSDDKTLLWALLPENSNGN